MASIKSAFWNIIYALFFVYLVLAGMNWLLENGLVYRTIPLFDFFLMAFAIFRLVRLFSYDVITKFLRDALTKAPAHSFFGTMSTLISCPWCTGLWFAFFVVFFYFATPLAWPIILILALAGIASLFQVLANLIGWHAEGKKRDVLGAGNSTSTCG
jgi:Protein of unknown function (DUF1360)